jgi:hypothetical protein
MSEVIKDKGLRGYLDVRPLAETRNAPKRIVVDGAEKVLRGYGLRTEKLAKKIEDWHKTGILPSPYTKGRYSDQLRALINLGVNKAHRLDEIKEEMKRLMSLKDRTRNGITDWDRFVKTPAHGKKARDLDQRIYHNFREFRRLPKEGNWNPVGFKLQQMGCCIDIFTTTFWGHRGGRRVRMGVIKYIRLNTHSTVPIQVEVTGLADIPDVDLRAPSLGPR